MRTTLLFLISVLYALPAFPELTAQQKISKVKEALDHYKVANDYAKSMRAGIPVNPTTVKGVAIERLAKAENSLNGLNDSEDIEIKSIGEKLFKKDGSVTNIGSLRQAISELRIHITEATAALEQQREAATSQKPTDKPEPVDPQKPLQPAGKPEGTQKSGPSPDSIEELTRTLDITEQKLNDCQGKIAQMAEQHKKVIGEWARSNGTLTDKTQKLEQQVADLQKQFEDRGKEMLAASHELKSVRERLPAVKQKADLLLARLTTLAQQVDTTLKESIDGVQAGQPAAPTSRSAGAP